MKRFILISAALALPLLWAIPSHAGGAWSFGFSYSSGRSWHSRPSYHGHVYRHYRPAYYAPVVYRPYYAPVVYHAPVRSVVVREAYRPRTVVYRDYDRYRPRSAGSFSLQYSDYGRGRSFGFSAAGGSWVPGYVDQYGRYVPGYYR